MADTEHTWKTVDGPEGGVEYDGSWYPDWTEAFFVGALGFCGCGSPEDVLDPILQYLDVLARYAAAPDNTSWPGLEEREAPFGSHEFYLLAAYVCDRAGLTDHGSSVYGEWITDLGLKWWAMVEKEVADG